MRLGDAYMQQQRSVHALQPGLADCLAQSADTADTDKAIGESPFADDQARASLCAGRWQEALALLDDTVSNRHSETEDDSCYHSLSTAYVHAITVCAEARQWQQALGLLEGMFEQSLEANEFTYESVIKAVETGSSNEDLAGHQERLLDLIEARHAAMMTATL